MTVTERYQEMDRQVREACEAAGRRREEVTLIAVSKTKPASDIRELAEAGVLDFGENYAKELVEKTEALALPLRWHFIGHLQTNKVRQVVGRAQMIHSVDSLHLGEAIGKESLRRGLETEILVEVNVGGEESKSGISPEELPDLLGSLREVPGIRVRGLMAIVPPVEEQDAARPYFEAMRRLLEEARREYPDLPLEHLSMGMTGDFRAAVREGSTMVRIGTAIFGERSYPNR